MSHTPDSQAIVCRLFQALERLKHDRAIRGLQTFTARYGINRWNVITLRREPQRNIFQPAWLLYLVRDYGVSPTWLITGQGSFYADNAKEAAPLLPTDAAPSSKS